MLFLRSCKRKGGDRCDVDEIRTHIIYTFIELNAIAAELLDRHSMGMLVDTDILYIDLLEKLFGLGKQLGFTFDQIEAEYLRKNAINHHRQECGY